MARLGAQPICQAEIRKTCVVCVCVCDVRGGKLRAYVTDKEKGHDGPHCVQASRTGYTDHRTGVSCPF